MKRLPPKGWKKPAYDNPHKGVWDCPKWGIYDAGLHEYENKVCIVCGAAYPTLQMEKPC